MSETVEDRERREWEERKALELETAAEIRNLAREVGDVKTIAVRTEAKVDEIDRRPPLEEDWHAKAEQVADNTRAIREELRPMLRLHHALGKWVILGLGSILLFVLCRWAWMLAQNGVGRYSAEPSGRAARQM